MSRIGYNYTELHKPKFYRYEVADPGFRFGFNKYGPFGDRDVEVFRTAFIGWYAVLGRYAYCVKWGSAKIKFQENE